jgi:hypothetical protein
MTAAQIAKALWPAARKLAIALGRWFLRRLQGKGAQWLARRMEARAKGYQTRRLNAALRQGRKAAVRFRRKQIARWLKAVKWLRAKAKQINTKVADTLDSLGWEERIPMTLPGEGRL